MPLRGLYRPDPFKKRLFHHVLPYVTAVVFSTSALLLTMALPSAEESPFFVLFFAAIVGCAWLHGVLSSLFSAILSAAALFYCVLPPAFTLYGKRQDDILRMAIFFAVTLLCSWAVVRLRKMQQELAITQERFRLAHEIARIWVWELDPASGKFIWSSRSMHPDSLQQESAQELFRQIHPEDRERVEKEINKAIENQQSYEVEFRIQPADGKIYWIASCGESYRTKRGEQRVIGANVDITSRKKAEETLEEAAKGELAGKLAHDINNPLQSLIHALYLIRHLTGQTEAFQYSELAHSEAERISRLLNEILQLYAKPRL